MCQLLLPMYITKVRTSLIKRGCFFHILWDTLIIFIHFSKCIQRFRTIHFGCRFQINQCPGIILRFIGFQSKFQQFFRILFGAGRFIRYGNSFELLHFCRGSGAAEISSHLIIIYCGYFISRMFKINSQMLTGGNHVFQFVRVSVINRHLIILHRFFIGSIKDPLAAILNAPVIHISKSVLCSCVSKRRSLFPTAQSGFIISLSVGLQPRLIQSLNLGSIDNIVNFIQQIPGISDIQHKSSFQKLPCSVKITISISLLSLFKKDHTGC